MKEFKASQSTAQYGQMSLHLRFLGKYIFIKGQTNSHLYVDKLIDDMKSKGALIVKGNGGWMRIDIVRDNDMIKLGNIELDLTEATDETIEDSLYTFFAQKYLDAGFMIVGDENIK